MLNVNGQTLRTTAGLTRRADRERESCSKRKICFFNLIINVGHFPIEKVNMQVKMPLFLLIGILYLSLSNDFVAVVMLQDDTHYILYKFMVNL